MMVSYSQKGRIIRTDAGDGEEKISNWSRYFVYRTGDYRCFCPDSAYNPVFVTRCRLLRAKL